MHRVSLPNCSVLRPFATFYYKLREDHVSTTLPTTPPQTAGAKRGLRILRDQSCKIINKEMVLRSLTVLASKGDLKISLTGAPWCRCLSNSCRRIDELHVHYIKGIIKCFYLVLNHQVISVTTLSYQLSCIMFCNQCRFALYRAQRKSEHAFYFPHGRQFVEPVNNATRVL